MVFPFFFFLVLVFQLEIRGKGNNKLRRRCFSNPSRRYFLFYFSVCNARRRPGTPFGYNNNTSLPNVYFSYSRRRPFGFQQVFFFLPIVVGFQRCISFGVSGAFNAKPLYLNGFFVNRLPPILHAQVEMVASITNLFDWRLYTVGTFLSFSVIFPISMDG